MLNFRIVIPAIKLPSRKRGEGRVFRMFKRLDDGSFLIAGFVNRYSRQGGYSRKYQ